ncbi:MAG: hypothetical protein IJ338_01525 [Bacteroidaceae bacterium]|nr:hypothetical protein [Bacteroidaceae bacterium]
MNNIICSLRLFLWVGILCVCISAASVKERDKESLTIPDDEPISFCNYDGDVCFTHFKGIIYNAIDKDYIENKNGITVRNYRNDAREPYSEDSEKTFQITSINRNIDPGIRAGYINAQITPLADAQNMDFVLHKCFLYGYERILVWALMPKSIEKVEYKTLQQRKDEQLYYYEGEDIKNSLVYFTLRRSEEYTSCASTGKNVLYIINGIEIPEKVFDALNPIFIRSLHRITDPDSLSKYNRKKLKEAVIIETFTYEEIIAPNVILSTGRSRELFYVNDIEITEDIFFALKPSYFKETQKILTKEENYRYIEGKHPEDNPRTKTIYKANI